MARLFLGNIPNACTELEIGDWVQASGFAVVSVEIIRDRLTGNPRGFGFVQLEDGIHTPDAIERLNGTYLRGRITVSGATPFTHPTASGTQL